jgi:hybrid cluster-associated redox disulfide protein
LENQASLFKNHPPYMDVLKNHGVHCVGCMMAHSESLEEGLAAHGLDVDEIIKEMAKTK